MLKKLIKVVIVSLVFIGAYNASQVLIVNKFAMTQVNGGDTDYWLFSLVSNLSSYLWIIYIPIVTYILFPDKIKKIVEGE